MFLTKAASSHKKLSFLIVAASLLAAAIDQADGKASLDPITQPAGEPGATAVPVSKQAASEQAATTVICCLRHGDQLGKKEFTFIAIHAVATERGTSRVISF